MPDILLPVVVIFLFAGFSKGVVGLGLPTIGIGLATLFLGLDQALALATLPVILTNIYQAVIGGHLVRVWRQTWPLMITATIFTTLATGLFVLVDPDILTVFLGTILMIYALISLWTVKIPPPGRHDIWLSPLAGILTGIVTVVTGSSVVPGVMYLQSLDLPRDAFVQSLGVLFSLTYIGLAIGLGQHDILNRDVLELSAIAILPALAGMVLGIQLRRRIPEERFKRLFLWAIFALGTYIFLRSLLHFL